MKKSVRFFVLVAVIVSLFLICHLSYAADSIKVGIVDTYTGPATAFTQDVLDGFKLAAEKINAKGGVLGKKIEYMSGTRSSNPISALPWPRS